MSRIEDQFKEFDPKTPMREVHEWVKKEFGAGKSIWIIKDPEIGKFYATEADLDEIESRRYQIISGGVVT